MIKKKGTKIEAGDKHNCLTIIEEIEPHTDPSGRERRQVHTICECGNQQNFVLTHIMSGRHKKCTQCAMTGKGGKYEIGDKFGMLEITGFTYPDTENKKFSKRRIAICKCDCGNVITKRPELLRKNEAKHCGCLPRWQGIGGLSNTMYYRIKRNAKIRGMEVNVTMEQLWDLFKAQNGVCAISGREIYFAKTTRDTGTASLDRRDSTEGYIIENCQWVHKDINLCKMDFTMEELFTIVREIYHYNSL